MRSCLPSKRTLLPRTTKSASGGRVYRALDGLTSPSNPARCSVLGPNGAGKTTTLKLLMQLVYPTSGTASILGRPLGDLEMKRCIGFLPENPFTTT
jgi:ABC-type multidrug transport system ATPase subunit